MLDKIRERFANLSYVDSEEQQRIWAEMLVQFPVRLAVLFMILQLEEV